MSTGVARASASIALSETPAGAKGMDEKVQADAPNRIWAD
ncbi:hypothetical protein EV658_111118 [Phaeovulum veldkampii DSM 11550]|nr:hypothetical protein EV658_111118 [Phaeovulum veldkampii DSM 11550]